MFTGFTKEASDFLWELAFNNERPWFRAHKEQYERCLGTPFKELALETARLVEARIRGRDWQLHISRIYRDARRLFGRGPFKDHLWFSLHQAGGPEPGPGFWFEVNAAAFLWGGGTFDPEPRQMENYRRRIAAHPAAFERMARSLEALEGFALIGDEYKRPKGSLSPEIDRWYNRKWVGLEQRQDFGGALLTPELPALLARDFEALLPLHDFLLEAMKQEG